MFSLISKLSRSRKAQACEPTEPAARAALVETLEDRRLNSASPVGIASFSWGATMAAAKATPILFAAAESGEESGTVAVNKASPKLFLSVRKAGGEQQNVSADEAGADTSLTCRKTGGGEASIIAVL